MTPDHFTIPARPARQIAITSVIMSDEDSKLLQLAAKAARDAGMPIIDSEAGPQILDQRTPDGTEVFRVWIPHEDGNDALLLAVTLFIGLETEWNNMLQAVRYDCNGFKVQIPQMRGDDPRKAACRAIVGAAADLGKSMP